MRRFTAAFFVGFCATLFIFFAVAANDASLEQQFYDAHNNLREQQGIPSLVWSPALAVTAQERAWQIANQGYLSHSGFKATLGYRQLAENIGRSNYPRDLFVPSIMYAFQASPSHYENIVDPVFTEIGIGVEQRGYWYYVAIEFGGTE